MSKLEKFPKRLNPNTITGQVHLLALELIEAESTGVRWADLQRKIKQRRPDIHPKTVNGCVWRLAENFPDRVFKPEKGLFLARRYQK